MPVVAILIGLLALGGGTAVLSKVVSENTQAAEISTSTDGTVVDSPITREMAIATALGQFAGTVGRVEQDTENGILVWKVRIVNDAGVRADIEVDANTGAVVRFRTQTGDEDENENEDGTVVDSPITREMAIATALGQFAGTVGRVEQDTENGILVWKVRIVNDAGVRADIEVDANTGAVVRFRTKTEDGINGEDNNDDENGGDHRGRGRGGNDNQSVSSNDDNESSDSGSGKNGSGRGRGRGGNDNQSVSSNNDDNHSGSGKSGRTDNNGGNSGSGSSGRDHNEND